MEPATSKCTPEPLIGSSAPMAIAASALVFLILEGLGGCALLPARQSDLQVSPTVPTATNPQTTRTATQTTPQTTPKNKTQTSTQTKTQTSTQTGTRSNRYDSSGQSFSCQTQNYFARITWQQTQPYLEFGRSSTDISSNFAATENQAGDGSVTYTSRGDQTITVRFLTTGSCNIRVVDFNGTVRVNEAGQVGNGSSSSNQSYWDGYNRGYQKGFRDGRNARLYNSGYNPEHFFQSGSQTGNLDYDAGFRVGYFRGFDEGYNDVSIRPTPTPLPEPLPPYQPGIPGSW